MLLSTLVPYKVVDPEIVPYQQEYLFYVQKYCQKDQYFQPLQELIEIKELPGLIIAQCQKSLTKIHIIYNKRFWSQDLYPFRMSTMIHEFSHCYFGEGHSLDPNNFMFAYENSLPLDTVKVQLEDYLKKKCSK